MFSKKEVDALFTDASRAFQRSQLLMEERLRGTPSITLFVMPKSPGFEAALRSLRGLMEFTAFLDASGKVIERLREECRQPSPGIEKKRRHGSTCPLLRRVVDGLVSIQDMWANDGASAESWWAGGAVVSAKLVLAGLFADWLHDTVRATEQLAAVLHQMTVFKEVPPLEGVRKDDLLELLSRARAGMPEGVAEELDTQVLRVACSLPSSLEESTVSAQLSALLLFPTLVPYIILHASPSLVTNHILSPVERNSAELLSVYLLGGSAEFHQACERLVQYIVLVGVYAAFGLEVFDVVSSTRRIVTFTKQLFDAFLLPIEGAFVAALPRVGMTIDVHEGLAGPFCRFVSLWQRESKKGINEKRNVTEITGGRGVVDTHTMSSVWCTASYRVLVVVETLAHAELGVVSGRGNAVAQQKKYYSMLQQSNGKVTTAILSTVTEDKQLLFEETTARSAQGHKVYRIHEGPNKQSVFVYIDNGIVYMKVGRERAFRRAKSVEEVFSVFVDSLSQT